MTGTWTLTDASTRRRAIQVRHLIKQAARSYFIEHGYLEVDTPILGPPIAEYPGGQVEALVEGESFWLPQSPQLYKEALIAAGVPRYFQFARCFRLEKSEGARLDRSIEFSQIDFELVCNSADEVIEATEGLVDSILIALGVAPLTPFAQIDALECIKTLGTDKPDLREAMKNSLAFVWVRDFPLLETTEVGNIQPSHHPFARPHTKEVNATARSVARTHTYDLVLNGTEIGGGDLRVSSRGEQTALLDAFELDPADYEPYLQLLDLNPPNHGGMAIGLERLAMKLLGQTDISDVIPFPMPR